MFRRLRVACCAGFGLLLVACEPFHQAETRDYLPQRNGFGQPVNVGLNQIDPIFQRIVQGSVILIAVSIDSWSRSRRA